MQKRRIILLITAMAVSLLAGCVKNNVKQENTTDQAYEDGIVDENSMGIVEIEEEAAILSEAPGAVSMVLKTVASGTQVKKNEYSIIDYSNVSDGYIMVKYTEDTSNKIKAQVAGPSGVVYTYNVTPKKYEVFPLSDGNGTYKTTIFQNISGTSYMTVLSQSFTVELTDEFAPFLTPNQYVNYTENSKVVKKAASLTKGITDPLDKVKKIYNYVVNNFTYDRKKAKTVKSGYLPDLDTVLKAKKGICFDYAAVMTAMLRSQGVPSKLVVGYSGDAYHAWINVYTDDSGWIDGIIFFDGNIWKLMDPTYASSGKSSKAILKYIGDGSNYKAKYLY